jgi:CRISPR-associated endonuclease/helicase Cas3
MDLIAYAKAKPLETLYEHTNRLLDNLVQLEELYREEIERVTPCEFKDKIWDYTCKLCKYHDFGKIHSHFQLSIRKNSNKEFFAKEIIYLEQKTKNLPEVPHNLLSPAFIYPEIKYLDKEIKAILIQSIAYHHYQEKLKKLLRQKKIIGILKEVFHKDIEPNVKMLETNFGIVNHPSLKYIQFLNIPISQELQKLYILLKGLLHRLDHSASAHLPVEEKRIEGVERKLIVYLSHKKGFKGLKEFQKQAVDLRDKNVLLIASTGIGKTEFAINWIGKDKAFYTLPLRVSVNAMYERFKKIFGEEYIGLLHGESALYGIDEVEELSEERMSLSEHLYRTELSRQFAMPITITTADQIFTSVFKWKGYEKIYATLMYAKVVLDEPQGYSPDTLAMIIKALQEIAQLGGRFCLMSATIHPFILQELKDACLIERFIKDKKHKIKCENKSIEELIPAIKKAYQAEKRILVIVNTVKKAQQLFERLKKEIGTVNLLHSQFIYMHRKKKEEEIFNNSKPVIWITTQLVEASLDIDYDILFTELASFDSLVQRMGRIYRKRPYQSDEPNIIIAMNNPSDKGKIYDKNILEFTKKALQIYDNKFLTEEIKNEIMQKIFDINLMQQEKVKFYEKFKENLKLLKLGFEVEEKSNAQQLFRNIVSLTAIPTEVYNDPRYQDEIETALKALSSKRMPKEEKLCFLKKLKNFTVSLPYYKVKERGKAEIMPYKGIFLVHIPYDEALGIIPEGELECFL